MLKLLKHLEAFAEAHLEGLEHTLTIGELRELILQAEGRIADLEAKVNAAVDMPAAKRKPVAKKVVK